MADETKAIKEIDENAEPEEEIIDPPDIDSKYRLIILAAQRSKQLQRGALPRVDADLKKTKPTRVAMKEFQERRINFRFTDQADDEAQAAE
ncbi:MAG: DNA-directed RNA polymerase subunit omega [Chloracidobacterium sp.]|nr:DNA-directed RNA polymerase subunit omega [Chloracidobacterium sp.]